MMSDTCVKHARQALAIDEQRFDFPPEIWVGKGIAQTLEQRWYCGVHANIGGGYVNDGLANLAYQWIVDEAVTLGLSCDRTFTGKYKAFAQDTLYDSKTKLYRIAELARFAYGKGARTLTGFPPGANLKPDSSVFTRLHANAGQNPTRFDRMTRYKPDNLIDLLRSHRDDLPGFIQSTGAKLGEPLLPKDILAAIHT